MAIKAQLKCKMSFNRELASYLKLVLKQWLFTVAIDNYISSLMFRKIKSIARIMYKINLIEML